MTTANIDVRHILSKHYGIEGTITSLPGEVDLNYHVKVSDQDEYVLKISSAETLYISLEFQHTLIHHLSNFSSDIEVPDIIPTISGSEIIQIQDKGEERYVRLLRWIPGRVWAEVKPHTTGLLESLGRKCGQISLALRFFDHPGAHRYIKWDPAQIRWVESQLDIFEDAEQRELAHYVYQLFEKRALSDLHELRQSVNHNDANDYNILVSHDVDHPTVMGVVDYGDAVYTYTINELAIAIAYAAMHKPDPLAAAASIIKGYHRVFPLEEKEVKTLFSLICARLLISVTVSAINIREHPENEYLQISDGPAWELLHKFRKISPELAHYAFRHACGWEPCTMRPHFNRWVSRQQFALSDLIGHYEPDRELQAIDLSVGSKTLGHFRTYQDVNLFERMLTRICEDHPTHLYVGGYGEKRPFYSTASYQQIGNNGPEWRTVHLGLDIWLPAGTLVRVPIDGVIERIRDNAGERNYGPTIILKHHIDGQGVFYTLYGHLDRDCLEWWQPGQKVNRGQVLGKIGTRSENGNWPPHLHVQLILDLLGNEGDFPGVCHPSQAEIYSSICPDPAWLWPEIPSPPAMLSGEQIISMRSSQLGKNLSISYQQPLHVVRGQMQYLLDAEGQRYLDMVNNVAHVGHEHPRVVEAAQRQIALLNTNTRYLHEELVAYTGALLDTFPPELEVCFLVNSGSETNELALRMAKTYSEQQDIIALKIGYHGNTGATIDVSSYKFDGKGGQGAPPQTHIVPMPDVFRGLHRDPDTAGEKYATYIRDEIVKIQQQGRGVAGLICESILSCGGQIVLPEGYLKHAYEFIRKAGGVCIADEVQVGFGRVGEHFWGFELQGVVPDIVTMGKPIGNGHPMGAVVTTRKIADAFANGMEYFNTFGGNPVSCAIGKEVLAVIKAENLQENALIVGNYLQQGLKEIMKIYPIIGDVRGHGLFLGFELLDEDLNPLARQATYLANRMREQGILMSTDGPDYNVLKIKPPMCIHKANMDFVLDTMEKVLREDVLYDGWG